ncbi:hypothetical protein GGI26_000486 [Coemansia sp. RSA 1358]|uniref:Uncharacterized protein n=1 Tax=Coemansia umbellata TaxID=1424467 RepID=A0ABQ8PU10_9FUNG|nr:hypothetical protein EDC05_001123 [Coemansia umbellata]KAJ2625686.1 hypothetical protein GGI26_000486 [Coemansia sp. RSA 1358]
MESTQTVESTRSFLAEKLEVLGSVLKSQIMSDLNAWEERRRGEAQATRNKKFSNKRPRPQPLPELPHSTLIGLREVRHILYANTSIDLGKEASSWCISILSVFVSVADMKGNCKLSDLISLPAAKAVFQLLVLAIESGFSCIGVETAEMGLVTRVLETTKDPRAIGWILNQYGVAHRSSFPKCLHLYLISQISKPNTMSAAESSGLTQAINDLAATFPKENTLALDSILEMYRRIAVDGSEATAVVAEDDLRRFILFYTMQPQLQQPTSPSQQQKQHLPFSMLVAPDLEEEASQGVLSNEHSWLADAIIFEMQSGFSQFLVYNDEQALLKPLSGAIGVLFGDTGRAKKVSDQPLDICKVLGVFSLINTAVRGRLETKSSQANIEDGDVEMKEESESSNEHDHCLEFIDSCKNTLMQLISREQAIVVLNQLPKSVKNMPQPIPNGLQEAVQRGGRAYNNGPITTPSAGQDETDRTCKWLFSLLSDIVSTMRECETDKLEASVRAQSLYKLVCEMAPMLVEIMVTRLDTPSLVKSLIRKLVEDWPVRFGDSANVDQLSVYALYRSLLAISEWNCGLLHKNIMQLFDQDLIRNSKQLSAVYMRHIVDLLGIAIEHEFMVSKHPAVETAPWSGPVKEVIGDLSTALLVSWRLIWAYCFSMAPDEASEKLGPDGMWTMRTDLVYAITKLVALPMNILYIDQLVLMEYALCELVRIQGAICRSSEDGSGPPDCSMGMALLARALMALVCLLARRPGIERNAMERLLRLIMLPASEGYPDDDDVMLKVFAIGCDDGALSASIIRSQGNKDADKSPVNDLAGLLKGTVLPSIQGNKQNGDAAAANMGIAERLLWQNAVRPMPKYPRSGMHKHDRAGDAWTFARPKKQVSRKSNPINSNGSALASEDEYTSSKQISQAQRPLLVQALLSLAYQKTQHVGMPILGQLLEEFYIDSIPSMPPSLLDEQLGGGRLQLRPVEMELLHDIRNNVDLEIVVFSMLQTNQPHEVASGGGANAVKRVVSALIVALIVLWNGALGEPTTKRQNDLLFTSRLVAHAIEAYRFDDDVQQQKARNLTRIFPFISGSDLARLLHVFVWRWVLHRMPSAEDDSQKLLMHILRRYIVKTAPLFKFFI